MEQDLKSNLVLESKSLRWILKKSVGDFSS